MGPRQVRDRAINPFSHHLRGQLKDTRLARFVAHWDQFEALVIRVYKGKIVSAGDEAEHQKLRAWLQREYPRWQEGLSSYWPLALVAGRPLSGDPFLFLVSIPQAAGFVRNRPAITTLPAARQALNQFVLDQIDRQNR